MSNAWIGTGVVGGLVFLFGLFCAYMIRHKDK